ncbi:MAG: hypothetical protein AB7F36_15920, partial [Reyranellaceae bacterium]
GRMDLRVKPEGDGRCALPPSHHPPNNVLMLSPSKHEAVENADCAVDSRIRTSAPDRPQTRKAKA